MFDYNASISSSNFHREPMLQIQGDKPGSQATGVRHGFGTMSWLIRMFFMKICNFLCKKIQVSFPPFHLQFLFLWYFMSMSTSELQYSEFWYPRCKVVIIGLTVCLAPKERRWCGFAAATAMGTRGQVCSFKVAKQFWNKRVELPKKKRREQKNKTVKLLSRQEIASESTLSPGTPRLAFRPFNAIAFWNLHRKREHRHSWTFGLCDLSDLCDLCSESVFFVIFWQQKWQQCDDWGKDGARPPSAKQKKAWLSGFLEEKAWSSFQHWKPWQCMPVTFWDKQLSTIIQSGHSKPDKIRSELTGGYQMWGLLS